MNIAIAKICIEALIDEYMRETVFLAGVPEFNWNEVMAAAKEQDNLEIVFLLTEVKRMGMMEHMFKMEDAV